MGFVERAGIAGYLDPGFGSLGGSRVPGSQAGSWGEGSLWVSRSHSLTPLSTHTLLIYIFTYEFTHSLGHSPLSSSFVAAPVLDAKNSERDQAWFLPSGSSYLQRGHSKGYLPPTEKGTKSPGLYVPLICLVS